MNIAIITACPSGVANSILAAGLLEKSVASLGWKAAIECQSTVVAQNTLSQSEIDDAEVIVIAANRVVDTSRFVGKKVYQVSIDKVIADPTQLLQQAIKDAEVLQQASVVESTPDQTTNGSKKIVAITACPTGVAHTFMAAEALDELTRMLYPS